MELQRLCSADKSKSEYSAFVRSQNLVGGLIKFEFSRDTQYEKFLMGGCNGERIHLQKLR